MEVAWVPAPQFTLKNSLAKLHLFAHQHNSALTPAYPAGITHEQCEKFINTAFGKNQESKEDAADYIAAVLVVHGVENPDIWWRKPGQTIRPAKLTQETKDSIKQEIHGLLNLFSENCGCAAYNKAKKEIEPDAEFRMRYEQRENKFAAEAYKIRNTITDLMEFLTR